MRAPSGDNVQPWYVKVAVDNSYIDLMNTPNKDTSVYNKDQLASFMAHGAFIENVSIAAQHFGFEAKVELWPFDSIKHVARIWFLPVYEWSEQTVDTWFNCINLRYTNRFKFKRVDLANEDLDSLMLTIAGIEGVTLHATQNRQAIMQLASVLKLNDRLVFEEQAIHKHFFSLLRWSDKEVRIRRDGMSVETLGLSKLDRMFFPALRKWWFVRIANLFGLSHMVAKNFEKMLTSSSMIGFITVPTFDKYDAIKAGRALQRVWLEATRQGLAFQPIVGLPLLMNQGVLKNTDTAIREAMGWSGVGGTLAVGFRLGLPTVTPPRTLRQSTTF